MIKKFQKYFKRLQLVVKSIERHLVNFDIYFEFLTHLLYPI